LAITAELFADKLLVDVFLPAEKILSASLDQWVGKLEEPSAAGPSVFKNGTTTASHNLSHVLKFSTSLRGSTSLILASWVRAPRYSL
jgi:hypothetical protein